MSKCAYYVVYDTRWSLKALGPFLFVDLGAESHTWWDDEMTGFLRLWTLPIRS